MSLFLSERGRGRHENAEALYEQIAAFTRSHTKHEVMKRLGEAGVPCSAVLDTSDLHSDPHLRARGFVKTVEHAELGPVPLLGWPARLSKSEVEIEAAPLLGQHTAEVVKRDLGLGDGEVRELGDKGVISFTE